MNMRQNPIRLYLLAALLFLGMAGLALRLIQASQQDDLSAAGVRQGSFHMQIPLSTGTIYDRSMKPLTNTEDVIYAAASPSAAAIAPYFALLCDHDAVSQQIMSGAPFVCELAEDADSTELVRVLHGKRNRSGVLPAQHLIGYRQNGSGVSGLEAAYSDWLSLCDVYADLNFTVSARGEVLAGGQNSVMINRQTGGGLVTTLDKRIQQIADTALTAVQSEGAAAVVMDCKTGDILACSSLPVYDLGALGESLHDPHAPFLNRALCAYNVGSVFKLVTAAAALESGITPGYCFECTGQTEIYGQRFRCHKLAGHGLLDMEHAMIESCNPYFISLSSLISAEQLHSSAASLGIGKEIPLADGISSAAGYLPSEKELAVAAEKANLCFGQGQLMATPLQICAMTACIANGGIYSDPRLVIGETADGNSIMRHGQSQQHRAISEETAATIRDMMQAVLEDKDHANGKPHGITAGGKTSTAQTGRYAEDGTEYCHAWMTGFFPAEDPQFAVTVFAENGGSGNQTAAPVFRRIIEEICR